MEAQLEVRTAVETLMEAGIEKAAEDYRPGDFPGVTVTTALADSEDPYYSVTVSDDRDLVTVETVIRAADPPEAEEGGEAG